MSDHDLAVHKAKSAMTQCQRRHVKKMSEQEDFRSLTASEQAEAVKTEYQRIETM